CYTVSGNGYGACGAYQYGNFDDFTINVNALTTGTTNAISNNKQMQLIEANPNPATDFVAVTIKNSDISDATLQLTDISGKIIQTQSMNKEKEVLDVSALSKGIYFLHFTNYLSSQCIKLVK
ncbi:MAG: T9SS type A sorting domain-containing protein, partial [Bacteroidia bacterium]|nr:T9SS type A sorting domain-containing protein [Bacteroidia bacterium]